jgi:hypothetical protein
MGWPTVCARPTSSIRPNLNRVRRTLSEPMPRMASISGDRLAVGDDSQRLQRRLRELRARLQPQEALDGRGDFGCGGELHAAARAL